MAGGLLLCGFYLLHSREYLQQWFVSLQPCFYRPAHWASDFFTAGTKARGNVFCLLAIPVCAGFLSHSLSALRRGGCWWRKVAVERRHGLPAVLLLLAGLALWIWANGHIRPYMDEVFSAVHISGSHPFQGLAYYMLPNNHLLFTALNNAFFHYSGDAVLTGRVLSGIAFLATLLLLYGWLQGCMKNRWLALGTVLLLALFYPAWGFAGQARGYSLLLLSGWAALIFLLRYFKTAKKSDLRWHALALIAGYAVMPTFLYLQPALLGCTAVWQLRQKRFDLRYWRYNLLAALLVFLFYLPALLFSGIEAFTANEFVRPAELDAAQFLNMTGELSRCWMGYCWTGHTDTPAAWWGFLPLLLPLALLARRRYQMPGLFLLLLWGSFYGFLLLMHRFPPVRALLFHLHLSFALTLLSAFLLLNDLAVKLRKPLLRLLWLPLLAPLVLHYGQTGRGQLAATLYHFDINEYGRLLQLNLRDLPPGASVGLSDESFYFYYIGRKRGFHMVMCSGGGEQFYMKLEEEALPQPSAGHYEKRWERGDWRIYERISSDSTAR